MQYWNDDMKNEQDDDLNRHYSPSSTELNNKIDELIKLALPAGAEEHRLYKELFLAATRLVQAERGHWDTKIAKNALTEMDKGFTLLERFKHHRKVTVFGSARTPVDHPLYQQAVTLGSQLADNGFIVITGAGGGIMAAAHEGAGQDNALGFNIKLPFEQYANETMEGSDALLTFQFFFIRKLFFVKETEAVVLCPGGFGTWDEAMEVLTLIQTGKTPLIPVILLETPDSTYWKDAIEYFEKHLRDQQYILPSDMGLMKLLHTPEEATQEIIQFYTNYNSSRWFRETFAIRMNYPLTEQALTYINQNYRDISNNDFVQQAYDESLKETEFQHLTYLLFQFTGKQHGRLRELVDYINLPENWLKQDK